MIAAQVFRADHATACVRIRGVTDREAILDAARRMAAAISRRDQRAARTLLAPGFVQRTIGGDAANAEEFLASIARIPGEILSVDLSNLEVDLTDDHAIVTGTQRARVRVDGAIVDDRRPFVDWMIRIGSEWRFRAAIDLPG
jgi:hypothetical protein